MRKHERKLIDYLEAHCEMIFFICITVMGVLMRYVGRNFVSDDYVIYLSKWYEEIECGGGFRALHQQVGNYSIMYQMVIALLTYFPLKPLYAYKIVSCCFDFFLALGCGILTIDLTEKKADFFTAYGLVWILPTVVMNSAFWAQCDSIYVAFIIYGIHKMLKGNINRAFTLWGIALAFKFQTIFVLPFLLFFYLIEKKYCILRLVWIVVVAMLTTLPAIFCKRGIWVLFDIYWGQHSENPYMTLNYPNFWAIMGGDYGTNKVYAVFLVITILGIGLYVLIKEKYEIADNTSVIRLLTWTIWTCLMFMPVMHERYGYLLELLLLILCVVDIKENLFIFIGVFISSLLTYGQYLYKIEIDLCLIGAGCLFLYCLYTFKAFTRFLKMDIHCVNNS